MTHDTLEVTSMGSVTHHGGSEHGHGHAWPCNSLLCRWWPLEPFQGFYDTVAEKI